MLKTEIFDKNDKNVFLLLNSHETEVYLSVQKASDRIFYWCCKTTVHFLNFNTIYLIFLEILFYSNKSKII